MAYIDTPWCSDNCHKSAAKKVGLKQKDLTPQVWLQETAAAAVNQR
jgi:hypothetical protein